MAEFELIRYDASMRRIWNEFVVNSRNATFLFDRGYMDYHADRFADCSWLAYKGNRLMALLPANITDDGILHSHGGLTYGGWILPPAHLDGNDVLDIFSIAEDVWKSHGIKGLDYKTLPVIYASMPSQEDRYALFRSGAKLEECNLSAAIDLRNPGRPNQLQRRHLAKASRLPISIMETDDIDSFMAMLGSCLMERHDAAPVHSSKEMKQLAERFPGNIRFHTVTLEGCMAAGVCIYDTGRVAHAQYIATTEEGRRLNLLTPLFNKLINEVYAGREWFDFGTSNENHGLVLNEGLLRQKYSYGATGVVYERYSIIF